MRIASFLSAFVSLACARVRRPGAAGARHRRRARRAAVLAAGPPAEQAESTLHPFAPHMTGRSAKELPLDKLKVPAGFKVEVWAEGIPEARSLALGDKGTVFVSNRNCEERVCGGRQAAASAK